MEQQLVCFFFQGFLFAPFSPSSVTSPLFDTIMALAVPLPLPGTKDSVWLPVPDLSTTTMSTGKLVSHHNEERVSKSKTRKLPNPEQVTRAPIVVKQ